MLPGTTVPNAVEDTVDGYRRLLDAVDGTEVTTVAPMNEDLSGLPPVAIHVGGRDLLRGDGEAMAARIGAAGGLCELHVWEGQMHDFTTATTLTPEGDEALDELSRFIERNA